MSTLGLWKQIINLVGDGVAFGFETHRGKTQYCAEHCTHAHQGEQGGKQRVLDNQFKHASYQASKAHKGQGH